MHTILAARIDRQKRFAKKYENPYDGGDELEIKNTSRLFPKTNTHMPTPPKAENSKVQGYFVRSTITPSATSPSNRAREAPLSDLLPGELPHTPPSTIARPPRPPEVPSTNNSQLFRVTSYNSTCEASSSPYSADTPPEAISVSPHSDNIPDDEFHSITASLLPFIEEDEEEDGYEPQQPLAPSPPGYGSPTGFTGTSESGKKLFAALQNGSTTLENSANTFTERSYSTTEYARQTSQEQSTIMINHLREKLSPEARIFFQPLLELTQIGEINEDSRIVSGDLDGSHARAIVLAIQAGIITLDNDGLARLAVILDIETSTIIGINNGNSQELAFKKYQEDCTIRDNLCYIAIHSIYKRGHRKLILNGDYVNDRLSNNKPIEMDIRNQLKAHGVIFIKGNHDSRIHAEKLVAFQQGKNAIQVEDRTKVLKEEAGFVHAHFEVCKNGRIIIYTHNGFQFPRKLDANSNSIKTAFGIVNLDEFSKEGVKLSETELISSFCEKINQLKANEETDPTDFRPCMRKEFVRLWEEKERGGTSLLNIFLKVIHVQGHSGRQNFPSNGLLPPPVINVNSHKINAANQDEFFIPTAIILGYY